jgi:hypothetical protein
MAKNQGQLGMSKLSIKNVKICSAYAARLDLNKQLPFLPLRNGNIYKL